MSQEELEQYINAYGKDLFSFCCSVTRSRQEAEDLYQDTFLKLYESRENLVIEKNPKSFLMGIAVNLYRNYKRKKSIRKRIMGVPWSVEEMTTGNGLCVLSKAATGSSAGFPVDIPTQSRLVEEQIVLQEECALVRRVVQTLPDKYRIPILLFYMEELSLKEIAAVLKLSEGAVKSRIFRAKKILKQKLERQGYHYEK